MVMGGELAMLFRQEIEICIFSMCFFNTNISVTIKAIHLKFRYVILSILRDGDSELINILVFVS